MVNENKKTMRIGPSIQLEEDFRGRRVQPDPEPAEPIAPASLHFYVFGEDRQVYGPATLSVLQEWAAQGLVSSETWVFDEDANFWKKGSYIKAIRNVLPAPVQVNEVECGGINPGQMRRIRLFSDMDDHQIEQFLAYLTKVEIATLKPVVVKGGPGNSMFLLLSGEARQATRVDGIEKTLAMLRAGDFFGEHALVEESPWPYDVMANSECVFLRLKHRDFQTILAKQPDLAARFLTAVVRHMSYITQTAHMRLTQAKAMVRGSLGRTSQIMAPPIAVRK